MGIQFFEVNFEVKFWVNSGSNSGSMSGSTSRSILMGIDEDFRSKFDLQRLSDTYFVFSKLISEFISNLSAVN